MTDRTIVVISAGRGQPSSTRLLADQLAIATRGELELLGATVRIETYELRTVAHDIVNNLLTGFPPAALRQVIETVAAADGLIAVSPIFNGSYSGLFKSFVDVLDDETVAHKPVLIAATGGTARHSLALEHAMRPLFTYLRAVVVPTSVYAAAEDWASDDLVGGALRDRIQRAAHELSMQINQRVVPPVPDPFARPTPFEDLLAGNS
jgi:FMN reductase